MPDVRPLLEWLTKAVPEGVRAAGLKDNSCILSTRLGVEALRARGFRARPLAVSLGVYNTLYQEGLAGGGFNQEIDALAWRDRGAWSVVISRESAGTGWSGHLVVVAEERYLVDLTAGQVKRLKKDIDATAFWIEARALARGEPFSFVNTVDACLWIYEPEPQRRDYLRTAAWSAYRITRRRNEIVSERTGPRPDAPVAPVVRVNLPR